MITSPTAPPTGARSTPTSSARRSRRARLPVVVLVALAVLMGAAMPAGALLTGVDVASWQHPNGAPINWSQVRSAGHSFAFVKATEGTTYRNPYFVGDFAGARDAGLFRGAYHYARPRFPLSSAVDQARYFVATTGTLGGPFDLPAVLDLEETGGLARSDLAQWARLWLAEVERLTGRPPIVYTGYYFWRDQVGSPADIGARNRLWLASYPADPNSTTFRPLVPSGWPTWTFWQYTDRGVVPGISGLADLNRYCCDAGNLAALAGGAVGAGNPFGNLEVVTRLPGGARVQGWTIDPDTTSPVGVHFYVDGRWAGQTTAGSSRLDVGNAYPGFGNNHGMSTTLSVGSGARQLCAYAINVGPGSTNPLLGCASLAANPVGNLESVAVSPEGSVTAQGWALDADVAEPLAVHLYVDGRWGTGTTVPVARPDVQVAYPGIGPNQGFSAVLPELSTGRHEVCAYALNAGPGTANGDLGCRVVDVPVTAPLGAFQGIEGVPGGARVRGWAIDFDTPDPIAVHFYANGRWAGATAADGPSPDVSAFFGLGTGRGFDATLAIGTGRQTVCAYAINVGRGSTNPLLGCRTIDRPPGPIGNLEQANRFGNTVRLSGWALDPDTADPIAVHVYVNGAWGGSATASGYRPDVGGAFPAYGAAHGFSIDVAVPPGANQVCVYLIDATAGSPNPLLRCRTV